MSEDIYRSLKDTTPFIDSWGTKHWYHCNAAHSIDVIEIEYSNGDKMFHLYGDHYFSEEEYNKVMSNLPLLYWNRYKEEIKVNVYND